MVSFLGSYGQVKVRRVVNIIEPSQDKEIYYVIRKGEHLGQKHGQYYYDGFEKEIVGEFNFNEKNGEWKTEFRNRKVVFSEYYNNGVLDSTYSTKANKQYVFHFNSQGDTIKNLAMMPNGLHFYKKGDTTYFYNSTSKKTIGNLVNDKRDGKWNWTTEVGSATVLYKDGKNIGSQTSYYRNGAVMCVKNYNDKGELNGHYFIVYGNGDTLLSQHYRNGKLHHTSQAWFPNKQLLFSSTYIDGRLIDYTEFKEDGTKNLLSFVTRGFGILIKSNETESTEYPIQNGMINGEVKTTIGDSISFSTYVGGILQEKKPNLNDEEDEADTTYAQQNYRSLQPKCASKATFPKDETGLQRFLAENVRYPSMAVDNDAQGTVVVVFVVDQLGNVVDISTINEKLGFGLEQAAMRVVQETAYMWTPATQDGFPVSMRYRIPIKFQLF
jgi:TonB family protein